MLRQSESERIALVRTVAPLVWSVILTQLLGWGIDFDAQLAEWLAVSEALVNGVATAVVAVVLWLLARRWPDLLERLLLIVRIDEYAYTQADDLVLPSGRVIDGATVIEIPPGGVSAVDEFTTAFLARQPSEVALRAAAGRLMDAAEHA